MTAILVHAAWADASNWNEVLLHLRASGVRAVAAQLPLTSLSDDVAALPSKGRSFWRPTPTAAP